MKPMKYILLVFLLIISCKESSDSKSSSRKDYKVAVDFINDYNNEFLKPNSKTSEWLSKNQSVTINLINRHIQILDSAKIADAELGLDFDPILNAQDSDENGFEIKKIDSLLGLVTVRGKSIPNFEITLKVIEENGITLVDGAGIINIPKSRLSKN